MNKTSSAFTMMEMMVVIFLIGVMATFVLPNLMRRKPSAEWPNVLEEVNNLVFFARQEAISHQKLFRIAFKATKRDQDFILVQEEKDDPEKPGRKIYEQVFSSYVTTKYVLPESISIDGLYHGKDETMEDNKQEGYCYVIADGLVQETLVRFTRKDEEEISRASFKMKPFFGMFEYFEGHIKPEK